MTTKISIYLNQIKYDVETETRKAGIFQVDHTFQEAMNEAQMGDEKSDKDYFKRRCQQGIESLIGVLHKFFVSCNNIGSNDETGTNELPQDTVSKWDIVLDFDGRRTVQAISLASMCHKYIVYHVLYNWAVMTMPNLVLSYQAQREAVRLRIQKMVYRKEPPSLSYNFLSADLLPGGLPTASKNYTQQDMTQDSDCTAGQLAYYLELGNSCFVDGVNAEVDVQSPENMAGPNDTYASQIEAIISFRLNNKNYALSYSSDGGCNVTVS